MINICLAVVYTADALQLAEPWLFFAALCMTSEKTRLAPKRLKRSRKTNSA